MPGSMGAATLRCVVYTSRSGEGWTEDALRALAEAAGRKNAALAVTGRLVVARGRFIQVLEGEAAAVAAVYAAILADPRHSELCLVLEAAIVARSFAGWSMDLLSEAMMTPQAVEAAALAAEQGDGLALLAGVADSFMARTLRTTPVRARAAETMGRLLDGAERLLLRGGMGALSIRALAGEAAVGEKTTYRYFSQPADVVRMLVRRRQLALFAAFGTLLGQARFASAEELARFVVAQALGAFFSDPRLPRRVTQALLRDYHDIAFEELWTLAGAVEAAMVRDLGGAGGAQARLAAVLAGLAGMAKMLALHAPDTMGLGGLARDGEALVLAAMRAPDGPGGPSG